LTGATFGLAASIGIGAKAASMGSKVVSALSKTISAGKGVISKAVSYGCKAINAVKTVANKAVGKVGDVMKSAGDSLKALGKHIQRSWNRLVGSGEGTGTQWAKNGFDTPQQGIRAFSRLFGNIEKKSVMNTWQEYLSNPAIRTLAERLAEMGGEDALHEFLRNLYAQTADQMPGYQN
jgi:hypothetical protein